MTFSDDMIAHFFTFVNYIFEEKGGKILTNHTSMNNGNRYRHRKAK